MEIIEQPLHVFLEQLASKAATPGGGSAAALMGAQSAALTAMVCRLTIGKPQYAAVEADMQALLEQAETLRAELTAMVKADVEAFDKLMACYGLPKASDAEKAARSAAIQEALKLATEVPLACARACRGAIELSRVAAEHGALSVISDAGAAVMSAYGGLKTAALNVYINTGSLKDKDFAAVKLAELDSVLAGAEAEVEHVYQQVKAKL